MKQHRLKQKQMAMILIPKSYKKLSKSFIIQQYKQIIAAENSEMVKTFLNVLYIFIIFNLFILFN